MTTTGWPSATARSADAGERRGDWMMTASGRQFWPLDPRAEDIDIADIASGLAHQGRYNGHTRHFYSVAQHCALLADHFVARNELAYAKWALLHDAAEAYVGDIIRPLKPYLPGFVEIERRIELAIAERFELGGTEIPLPVKEADTKILTDEFIALFPVDAVARHRLDQRARLGIEIRPLFPTVARDLFMARFRGLFG